VHASLVVCSGIWVTYLLCLRDRCSLTWASFRASEHPAQISCSVSFWMAKVVCSLLLLWLFAVKLFHFFLRILISSAYLLPFLTHSILEVLTDLQPPSLVCPGGTQEPRAAYTWDRETWCFWMEHRHGGILRGAEIRTRTLPSFYRCNSNRHDTRPRRFALWSRYTLHSRCRNPLELIGLIDPHRLPPFCPVKLGCLCVLEQPGTSIGLVAVRIWRTNCFCVTSLGLGIVYQVFAVVRTSTSCFLSCIFDLIFSCSLNGQHS
jgi:hypothetical protein